MYDDCVLAFGVLVGDFFYFWGGVPLLSERLSKFMVAQSC